MRETFSREKLQRHRREFQRSARPPAQLIGSIDLMAAPRRGDVDRNDLNSNSAEWC